MCFAFEALRERVPRERGRDRFSRRRDALIAALERDQVDVGKGKRTHRRTEIVRRRPSQTADHADALSAQLLRRSHAALVQVGTHHQRRRMPALGNIRDATRDANLKSAMEGVEESGRKAADGRIEPAASEQRDRILSVAIVMSSTLIAGAAAKTGTYAKRMRRDARA
jgi:hypothetical protein